MQNFLIHYGEIALKKKNRSYFEEALLQRVASQVKEIAPYKIRRLPGRLWLEFQVTPDQKKVFSALQKVFGLANFIPCARVEVSLEKLKQELTLRLKEKKFASFAVRAKRGEENFPLSSQFVNEEIGGFVKELTGMKVDLEEPEMTIHIELFNEQIFFGFEKIQGLGGLPVGIAGRVVSLLSGGIDSPVAAFRMMKRGCEVLFVHFHSAPFTKEESLDKVLELAENLSVYQGGGRLITVPFGEIQRQIVAKTEESYRVLLYRRMMLRIAEALAREYACEALVTGESLSQVASQTLSNLSAIENVAGLPVLRPLIGMDKVEIIAEARKMGTFEISTRPHEDCCSFMLPKHPKTRSTAGGLDQIEKVLEVDEWVRQGVKGSKVYGL